jgi:hypothetical protein
MKIKVFYELFERIESVFDERGNVKSRKACTKRVLGNKIDTTIKNDGIHGKNLILHEYIGSELTEVSMPHHKAVSLVDELSKYYLGKVAHQNGVEWNEMLFEKYLHYRSVYGELLGLKKPQVA